MWEAGGRRLLASLLLVLTCDKELDAGFLFMFSSMKCCLFKKFTIVLYGRYKTVAQYAVGMVVGYLKPFGITTVNI